MIKKIKFFLNKKQQVYLVILFIGILLSSLLEMIGIGSIPIFISFLIEPNKLLAYLPQNNLVNFISNQNYTYQVTFFGAILLGIFIFKNLFLFVINYFQAVFFSEIKIKNSERLFTNYLYSPYSFHLDRNPATVVRDIFGEVQNSCRFLDLLMICAREVLIIFVIFILLLIANPSMSLIIFSTVVLFVTIFNFVTKKKITLLAKRAQIHSGIQIKIINQVLGAIKDTKILHREKYFIKEFVNETKGIEKIDFFSKIISLIPRLSIEVLGVLIILFLTSFFIISGHTVESMIPMLGLLGVATIRIIPSFNLLAGSIPVARKTHVSFNLIVNELINLEKFDYTKNILNAESSEDYVLKEGIEVKNISYQYPGSKKNILEGVSFAVKSKSLFGIIGATGAGKSTLIDIILGLLIPSNGEINVDGKNIKINYRMWQKKIAYIPQDIYILDDTIRKNVAFGISDNEIKESNVNSAIKLAQLSEFVANLPRGLDTIVGNRGIKLSGGQRQRLGIARALYRQSKILILDEATSSLDIETERNLINDIENLSGEYTIIIVTHRLSTIKNCNDVIFLSKGKLIDQGKLDDLVLRHESLKTDLYKKISKYEK